MKHSNDTIGNETRDLPACSAVVIQYKMYIKLRKNGGVGYVLAGDYIQVVCKNVKYRKKNYYNCSNKIFMCVNIESQVLAT